MMWKVVCDDVISWAKTYGGPKFHAMLADPPYHLTSGGGVRGGFMGAAWDGEAAGVGVAFRPETWAALAEHLLPGGFVMAFGGARTYHRLACAMEDSGLIIHPAIGWVQGASFPKATRIDTQVDKHRYNSERVAEWLKSLGDKNEVAKAAGVSSRQVDHWIGENTPCPQALSPQRFETICVHFQVRPDWADDMIPLEGDLRGLRIHARSGGSDYPKRPGARSQERVVEDRAPSHHLACVWQGHRYGRQMLKPALSLICVAQKPYPKGKKTWESIVETGAGALNIDGSRIGFQGNGDGKWHSTPGKGTQGQPSKGTTGIYGYYADNAEPKDGIRYDKKGRWPANFLLCHVDDQPCQRCGGEWENCPDCQGTGVVEGCKRVGTKRVKSNARKNKSHGSESVCGYSGPWGVMERDTRVDPDGLETITAWECVESCPVRRLGEQAGFRGQPGGPGQKALYPGDTGVIYSPFRDHPQGRFFFDAGKDGTAARFFFQADWHYEVAERLAQADPVRYQSKASRKERDAGLEGMLPQKVNKMGSFGDQSQYDCPDGAHRVGDKGSAMLRNPHPCVKPLSLCKWICQLLAPPPEYAPRRLLIPFAGSGSEMLGAMLSGGWEEIVGIEMMPEYVEIAEARLRWWAQMMKRHGSDVKTILSKSSRQSVNPDQLSLF